MSLVPAVPDRRSVRSWLLYDLANTVFALGVVGLYLPDWLTALDRPDSALAAVEATVGVIVVFLAPWVGARSDVLGNRVSTLFRTTLLAVAGTALIATWPPVPSLIFVGIALVGFNVGSVVYDALLVDVSTPANRGRISGLGVGIGYIGSYVGLAIGVLTLDVLDWSYAATFRSLAVAFLIFSIPAFLFIREGPGRPDAPLPGVRDVISQLIKSWRLASRYDGMTRFLVGRFLYTDAINTLIGGFLAIFVIEELGMERRFVTALLGVAITAAIVGGIGAGLVVERHGPGRVLSWVLVLWMIGIGSGVLAAISGQTWLTWGIGALGGIALGATWASDRVMMTRVSPPRHLGQFYGLYATVGRFATILGPLAWAFIVDGLGFPRTVAMTALLAFVVGGWVMIRGVDDGHRSWGPEDLVIVSETPDAPRK